MRPASVKRMNSKGALSHPPVLLFLFLTSLYLLTMAGYPETSMGVTAFLTAMSLIEEGDVSLEEPTLETGVGKDGHYYTYEGLAFILVVAFFGIISTCAGLLPHGVFFTNQILTSFACLILFFIGRELKYSTRTSILLALIYGIGTMAWVHSRFIMPEPLTTIIYLTSFLFLLRYRNKQKRTMLLLCGIFTGVALLVRPDAPIFILAIIVGVFIIFYDNYRQRRKGLKTIASDGLIFLLPLFLFFFVYVYYNHMRFGKVFEVGYATKAYGVDWMGEGRGAKKENIVIGTLLGFAGMWIVPCRSMFFINPVLIFMFWAVKDFLKKYRFEFIIIFIVLVLHVLLYSSRGSAGFSGSSAWGIRYMVPIAAFMVILMGTFVEKIITSRKRRSSLKWFIILFTISALFQIIGASINYQETQMYLEKEYSSHDDVWSVRKMMNFNPRWNLITMNLQWLRSVSPDFMYFSYFHQNKVNLKKYLWQEGVPAWVELSLVLLILTLLLSGFLLYRRLLTEEGRQSRDMMIRGKKERGRKGRR